MIDHAESQLYKLIDESDTIAIIFFLRTRGRKRGYSERYEVGIEGDTLRIDINGVDYRNGLTAIAPVDTE